MILLSRNEKRKEVDAFFLSSIYTNEMVTQNTRSEDIQKNIIEYMHKVKRHNNDKHSGRRRLKWYRKLALELLIIIIIVIKKAYHIINRLVMENYRDQKRYCRLQFV